MGYDLMSEPWPGNGWQACANSEGCPPGGFDQDEADRRSTSAVLSRPFARPTRSAPDLVRAERALQLRRRFAPARPRRRPPRLQLPRLLPRPAPAPARGRPATRRPRQRLRDRREAGLPERGRQARGDRRHARSSPSSARPPTRRRSAATSKQGDRFMQSWQWWHYCPCIDPTTAGPGTTQAIVNDPAKPPEGDNVVQRKLGVLSRAYPQAVAGVPERYRFDAAAKRFEMSYTTARLWRRTLRASRGHSDLRSAAPFRERVRRARGGRRGRPPGRARSTCVSRSPRRPVRSSGDGHGRLGPFAVTAVHRGSGYVAFA